MSHYVHLIDFFYEKMKILTTPVELLIVCSNFLLAFQMNDLYEEVKNSLNIYFDTVQRVTEDQVNFNRGLSCRA